MKGQQNVQKGGSAAPSAATADLGLLLSFSRTRGKKALVTKSSVHDWQTAKGKPIESRILHVQVISQRTGSQPPSTLAPNKQARCCPSFPVIPVVGPVCADEKAIFLRFLQTLRHQNRLERTAKETT